MTAVELEKNLREDYAKFVRALLISSVSGEDPGAEDEVGRGTPEAAILYCDTQVHAIVYVRIAVKQSTKFRGSFYNI